MKHEFPSTIVPPDPEWKWKNSGKFDDMNIPHADVDWRTGFPGHLIDMEFVHESAQKLADAARFSTEEDIFDFINESVVHLKSCFVRYVPKDSYFYNGNLGRLIEAKFSARGGDKGTIYTYEFSIWDRGQTIEGVKDDF